MFYRAAIGTVLTPATFFVGDSLFVEIVMSLEDIKVNDNDL